VVHGVERDYAEHSALLGVVAFNTMHHVAALFEGLVGASA